MGFVSLLRRTSPELPLRVGFGIMYLYSGWSIFSDPRAWYWAIPEWLSGIIEKVLELDVYLKFQGAGEMLLGLLLLAAWFIPPRIMKWIALLGVLEVASILLFTGVDQITFRDIGLLGGLAGLFVLFIEKGHKSAGIQ